MLLRNLGLSTALGLLLTSGAFAYDLPARPTGLGFADEAPIAADVPAYVDFGATNQRGQACMSDVDGNAGVRLLAGFLDVWTPSTPFVDADVEAAAEGDCAAVAKADWDGVPGSDTDGAVVDATTHKANIDYVIEITRLRTQSEAVQAYLDDRRGKNVSMMDGLGPLSDAWRAGAWQSSTISYVPADADAVKYDDNGNNRGVGSLVDGEEANGDLGLAVDLIVAASADGSTEPAKRYFKYARPWRWAMDVSVLPTLEPAKSGSPGTDGGFPSGHTAEAWRDGLALAYLVPERYQEILTRSVEMGDSRILAGMHSPLDVIGGRMLGTAVVVYNFNRPENAQLKQDAYAQAQGWLMRQTGAATPAALFAAAHAAPVAEDRFADPAANLAYVASRTSYGFAPVSDSAAPVVVPKGAEVLLETRLPYLSAEQRRVVLKTTAWPAGYPVMNDAEGFGRLDYIKAADGYGAFDGDVVVTMDGALGGFNASDSWRNDIAGKGMLTKQGSGSLTLAGNNSYAGGTVIEAGRLTADNSAALGSGDVYVAGGTLATGQDGVVLKGNYTQLEGATLLVIAATTDSAALVVEGNIVIEGGTLDVQGPATAGAVLQIVSGQSVTGRFTQVLVNGQPAEASYTGTAVNVTVGG
ncbi:phospholipid phosphatase [Devosia yakushimensis]|uniref:Phospholipid phosphatase n=1 Tax=Devosia yakushimensis TaxID=470028 RepID=A0ABQ5UAJ5_9HYPH|nr:phosphatase PAP2 family protein [Devosia yakushimensis]GLQ08259.1 phospholipid phosphatase [Devosia yakushimensis]